MSESKRITMEMITFIKYKDECYELGEVLKSLLNNLDEKDQEIEILVKDDETSQQTIINQRQEIERLNNIINKINKLFEADTHCEDIYYAIGVVLNKKYYDIEMISNEEILNILGSEMKND